MAQMTLPLKTHISLHPLLYYFNIILNFLPNFIAVWLLLIWCHSEISKRAVKWILVRVIIGFVNFFVFLFFVQFFFVWKQKKRYDVSWTTLFSILYITVIAVEFSWMVIGTVFFNYVSEVQLSWFSIFALTYLICSWVEVIFLPPLFLCFLIVQIRRYQRYHKYHQSEREDPLNPTAQYTTGGCCACCVEDDEDRCCCCRCACCDPRGVMASYIMGDEPMQSQEPTKESSCCCCCGYPEMESSQENASPMVTSPEPAISIVLPADLNAGEGAANDGNAVRDGNDAMGGDGNASASIFSEPNCSPDTNREESSNANTSRSGTPAAPAAVIALTPSSMSNVSGGTPRVLVIPAAMPSNSQNRGEQSFSGMRLVEAVADDGSGRTVYIAVPFGVCGITLIILYSMKNRNDTGDNTINHYIIISNIKPLAALVSSDSNSRTINVI